MRKSDPGGGGFSEVHKKMISYGVGKVDIWSAFGGKLVIFYLIFVKAASDLHHR